MQYLHKGFKFKVNGLNEDSLVAQTFNKFLLIDSLDKGEIIGYARQTCLEFDPIINAQGCTKPFNGVEFKKIVSEPYYCWKPGHYIRINTRKLLRINSRPELDFFIKSFTCKVNGQDTVNFEKVAAYYDGVIVSRKNQKILEWCGDILLFNDKPIIDEVKINIKGGI